MRHFYTDLEGNTSSWETPDIQIPLNEIGVIATINAIINPEYIDDYANALGLTAQDLINEATAWAVAKENI